MNCNKILKLLPLYISDDLGESELSVIETHLGACLNCYREYQGHLKSLRALKQLGEKPDLSPVLGPFCDEVMQRIASDPEGPEAPVPKVIYPFIPRTLAAAALVIAALATFYFFSGNDAPQSGGTSDMAVNPSTVNSDLGSPGEARPLFPMKWLENDELGRRPDTLKRLHFPKTQPVNFRDF